MFVALADKSAANSAILRVYASASLARSKAFLKRAVAINSIVRVILRMLRIALRRFTITREFAMMLPDERLPNSAAACRFALAASRLDESRSVRRRERET